MPCLGTVLSTPAKQPPHAAASYHHEQNRQCDCSCKHCDYCCERKDVHNAIRKCEKHAFSSAAKMGLHSLGDCPDELNSRGRRGSVAVAACRRACARCPRGRRRISRRLLAEGHGSPYLIRNASMRPQPPLLAGASVRRPSASCPGESGRRRISPQSYGPASLCRSEPVPWPVF